MDSFEDSLLEEIEMISDEPTRSGCPKDNSTDFDHSFNEEWSAVDSILPITQTALPFEELAIKAQVSDTADITLNDINEVIATPDKNPLDLNNISVPEYTEEEIKRINELAEELMADNDFQVLYNLYTDSQMETNVSEVPSDEEMTRNDTKSPTAESNIIHNNESVDILSKAIDQTFGRIEVIVESYAPLNESSAVFEKSQISGEQTDFNQNIGSDVLDSSVAINPIKSLKRKKKKQGNTPQKRGRRSLEERGFDPNQISVRRREQNSLAQKRRRIRAKENNAIPLTYLNDNQSIRLISGPKFTAFIDLLEKLRTDRFDGSHQPHIDYLLDVMNQLPLKFI